MYEDPIVQEIPDSREKHAERFNFDLLAIHEDFKEQEEQSERLSECQIISLPPPLIKPVSPGTDSDTQELAIPSSEVEPFELSKRDLELCKEELAKHQIKQTVVIEVPDVILEQYPTMEALQDSIYESMIIREFQKGMLTIRECAQILGLTYEGFIDWLGVRKLSFVTATREELEESYNNFEKFMETYQKPQ